MLLPTPSQAPPPRLRPCATLRGRPPDRSPPYIPGSASRERRRDPGKRAARIGWAGVWTAPLHPPPTPLQRALGAKTLPGARAGLGGCACSLGHLKGKFMLSVPASRGNTVSLPPHAGRCIYSSRGFSLGQSRGQRGGPVPQAKLSLTSVLHGCIPGQEISDCHPFLLVRAFPARARCLDLVLCRALRSCK